MSEVCYTQNCGFAEHPIDSQSESARELCDMMTKAIVKTGGSGLIETYPCPFVAIANLVPIDGDSEEAKLRKSELSGKLGIVGFLSQGGLL